MANPDAQLRRNDWFRLGSAGLFSLAVHGLLLCLVGSAQTPPGKIPTAMQVSLRNVTPAVSTQTAENDSITLISPHEEGEDSVETPAEAPPEQSSETPETSENPPEAAVPNPEAEETPSSPVGPSGHESLIPLLPPDTSGQNAADDADVIYYPPKEVQVRPVAKSAFEPFPPGTLPPELTGKVIVTLYISAKGEVVRILPHEGSIPPEALEKILERFKLISFSPGQINGMEVASMIRIEVWLTPEHLEKEKKDASPPKPVYAVPPRIVQ